MKQAANSSETSLNFYQTTRCNNPEKSHLHTRHRENLKSQLVVPLETENEYTLLSLSLLLNIAKIILAYNLPNFATQTNGSCRISRRLI
jgi:hypothetical protein